MRQALEPWHVLGEETAAGGTVRYVDSSLERLQVKVRGMIDYAPSHCLQRPCSAAASHRHRGRIRGRRAVSRLAASAMPASHHSRTRAADFRHRGRLERALDRGLHLSCRHPGGRNYDTLPVNAYEAESRRLSRFFEMGHTPGPMQVAPAERNPEFPFTLDLRCLPIEP